MVLPPVETTPVLLMRFTEKASPDLVTLVKERLCLGGMIVVTDERSEEDGTCILGLTSSQQELEAEAEQVHMMKKMRDNDSIEYFTVSSRSRFVGKPADDFHERDQHGLFTPNDWAYLVGRLLRAVTVLPEGQVSTNLSRMLDLHGRSGMRKLFSFHSRDLNLREHEQQIKLEMVLRRKGYVDVITPVHIPRCRDRILKETMKLTNFTPPVDTIGAYYGKKVAFYFAWMGFLTKWLLFPGLLGLVTNLTRLYRNDTIDTDEYTPFYGLITFIWAVLFQKFWQRHENRLSYRWGTFSLSAYEKQKFFARRPQFQGVLRKSPVTGCMETYYPDFKRRLQYVVSGSLTAILLGVAFSVMIMSLNLQGYIRPKNDPERWNDEHPHPFHYPFLSILAEEGNLFDAASQWRCYVPVLLHSICILAMNTMYRRVAEWLTEWENHETEQAFQDNMVLKRFLFEAFDCYVALFYLAFYERDVDRLRGELVSVFYIDTFRRLLIECILPMVLHRLADQKKKNKRREVGYHKKTDELANNIEYAPLTAEANRDEYEQFDDYMEIVIQLGYVTLFASAYPLASLIAIVANLVEIRADCFKLTRICQRPPSIRADGLGMWKTLVSCIIWLSALTNCLIFGFTSRQLMQWMPDFYYVDGRDHLRMVPGKGWLVVFIIFGVERLLLLLGILIHKLVPDVPEDVVIELERRQYLRFEERKAARVSTALYNARQRRMSEMSEEN